MAKAPEFYAGTYRGKHRFKPSFGTLFAQESELPGVGSSDSQRSRRSDLAVLRNKSTYAEFIRHDGQQGWKLRLLEGPNSPAASKFEAIYSAYCPWLVIDNVRIDELFEREFIAVEANLTEMDVNGGKLVKVEFRNTGTPGPSQDRYQFVRSGTIVFDPVLVQPEMDNSERLVSESSGEGVIGAGDGMLVGWAVFGK